MATQATQSEASGSNDGAMFWMIAVAGVGLLALAQLVYFFIHVGDVANAGNIGGKIITSYIAGTLGAIAASVGMALAAWKQTNLSGGARVALLLGSVGVYFLLGGLGISAFLR